MSPIKDVFNLLSAPLQTTPIPSTPKRKSRPKTPRTKPGK